MSTEFFDPNEPMADFNAQIAAAEKQKKLAELLRLEKTKAAAASLPSGQMVGKHYVAPATSQHVSALLDRIDAGQAGKAADAKAAQLEQLQQQALVTEQQRKQQLMQQAQQWEQNAPMGTPAVPGTAPPDELGGGPPTEGTPAQQPTFESVLKHTMAGYGNPYSRDQAKLYGDMQDKLMTREDTQAARAAEKAAQIEAQKARDAADRRWREDQAEQNRQLRMTLKGMGGGGGSGGGSGGGAGGADFGGPAQIIGVDPNTNQQIFRHTKSGQPFTYGADGQPVAYNAGMANKPTTAGTKDVEATAALDAKLRRAEEELTANPDAVGVKTMLPNFVSQFTSPEGVPGRLAVAELSAEKAHELYGAAFTDAERIRANAFLPAPGDTQATTKAKLAGMRKLVTEAQERQRKNRGVPGGGASGSWGDAPPAPAGAPKVVKWGELK